jgi:hypothetical protein
VKFLEEKIVITALECQINPSSSGIIVLLLALSTQKNVLTFVVGMTEEESEEA